MSNHGLMRMVVIALAGAGVAAGCGSEAAPGGGGGGGGAGGGGVGFGGAQDIGEFRAILDAGQIPGPDTLDPGGFFAEHYSELPPADCGQPLCLVGMMAVGRDWVHHQDQAVLQVSLSTPIDPTTLERKPLNLVVVIDTSGSMSLDQRINYARQGLDTLIDQLHEGDRLALVSFGSEVTVWNDLSASADPAALHAIVDQLTPAGGTYLYGGLERGFQLAAAAFDPSRQNRVILMSDGLANIGVSDSPAIEQMADGYLADGLGLTTIGVGLDFNVNLMRGLAERGAGNFYFLEDPSAIAEVFTEELDYFVTPLALDVNITAAAESGWTIGEVLGSHAWSGSSVSGTMHLPGVFVASRTSDQPGDLGRRGAGGALFVTMVPQSGSAWDLRGAVAALHLRYRLPDSDQMIDQDLTVTSQAQPSDAGSVSDVWLSHEAMAEHYSMYNMLLGLREATQRASWGQPSCALGLLELLDSAAAIWQADFQDPDIAADRDLVAEFEDNLRAQGIPEPAGGDVDGTCANQGGYGGGGYDDPGEPYYGPDACSAGGGAAGLGSLALVVVALVVPAGRRRRGRQRSARA